MSTIRVVWGSATGPTPMAAYDAALADANCHDYNLVRLSSVIPAETPVRRVGTAPDLGPPGNRLSVVEARASVTAGEAVAGLGWVTNDAAHGVFYETTGESDAAVRDTLRTGVCAGCALRNWPIVDPEIVTQTVSAPEPTPAGPIADGSGRERDGTTRHGDDERSQNGADTYATAVVLAVYGQSDPIL